MRAVVFAYHNMGIAGLEALKRAGFEIPAVFSHADDPDEKCWFASVVSWAQTRDIPVYCPADVNAPAWVARIAALAPEAIFSFYYRKLLGNEILAIPPAGAFNLHGSLLPAYRGRVPVNWVLVNGEEQTGVTLHYMTAKPDAGDIVGQRAVAIDFADTAVTLYEKLCREAVLLLGEVLPLIRAGRAPRIPQDVARATYFGGRKPADGRIDWTWPARRIYNLIRAVTDPYPGAFTFLPDGTKMFVWWGLPDAGPPAPGRETAAPSPDNPTGAFSAQSAAGGAGPDLADLPVGAAAPPPGQIGADAGGRFYVQTGAGRLFLLDIEIAGRRMKGAEIGDFFRRLGRVVLA
ncbi:MAG TPA: formyltransferase [Syntrophales bacterium]|nr:formyltransferase [Syntrophales bacterium]HOU77544.1 formyltransferase [Syntrophales bacterium]HPC31471.1 formyltransferase [Syntrophales bacterium]HQG35535.1 formyltransferase [Syntrophales bacterium]HRR46325.1 formyltransferase [Syntrophales bacterium]